MTMYREKPETLTDQQLTHFAAVLDVPVKFRAALARIAKTQKRFTALRNVVAEIMMCNGFKETFDQQVMYRQKATKGTQQAAYFDVASVYLARWGVSSKLLEARVVQSEAFKVPARDNPSKFYVLPLWAVSVPNADKQKELQRRKDAGEEFTAEDERDFLEPETSLADERIRDGLPMAEEENIAVPDVRLHMHWVYEHLDDEDIKMRDAPSKGAWSMLQEARKDKSTFFNRYWTVFSKDTRDADERANQMDDGRHAIALIGELKAIRMDAVRAGDYVAGQAPERSQSGER